MRIPIAFSFQDNYALPASVAIASLLAAKDPETEYEVIVLHDGLDSSIKAGLETICPIRWIKVDDSVLGDVPSCGSWGRIVYYRLLISELLPEYDRVLWSDVDVVFKGDLSEAFRMDLGGAAWAGVVVEESNALDTRHCKWGKNDRVYIPSFMVVDLATWRKQGLFKIFIENLRMRRDEIRMCDMDILNMSCSPIAELPFSYCVLENVMYSDDITLAHEWPRLRHHHSREDLERAKREPVIIHYAGGRSPKVWRRRRERIPDEYWSWLEKSPFFDREYFFPGWRTAARRFCWKLLAKIHPLGCRRKDFREQLRRKLTAKAVDPVFRNRGPFADDVKVSAPDCLSLGRDVQIGEGTRIFAEGGVRIGDFTKIGDEVRILSFERNRGSDWMVPFDNVRILRAVEIGRFVEIGARSIVQSGVKIGDGAILEEGSVVFQSVPERAIVAGNPARIVGWREEAAFRRALDRDWGAGGLTNLDDFPVKHRRIEGFREELSGGNG